MNNRGFTLIEIIGIILVLAAIFLVTFPSFLSTAKYDKEKEYDNMVETLCLAGETYIYSHTDDYEELSTVGSTININIEELIYYGSVDKDTKNVKSGNTIENDSLTYTVLSDNSLDCKYNW